MISLQKIVIVALLGLAVLYIVRNNAVIKNNGSVTMDANGAPANGDINDMSCSSTVPSPADGMEDLNAPAPAVRESHSQVDDVPFNTNVLEFAQPSNNFTPQGNFLPNNVPANCLLAQDMVKPSELLPQEGCFEESNPSIGAHLTDQNFLTSGHHAGINTQGSSLRNPNLQIRSDPIIQRVDVGPWSQSTIEADTNRRMFEIGCV